MAFIIAEPCIGTKDTACVDACPVDALELTQDFELASYTREGGIWDRQMLEEGPRPTQYK